MKARLLLTVFLLAGRPALAIDTFVESFTGNGPYTSVDGTLTGLDNPDWDLSVGSGTFQDGGPRVENQPIDEYSDGDILDRFISGHRRIERFG
jgi:hypothetical protein